MTRIARAWRVLLGTDQSEVDLAEAQNAWLPMRAERDAALIRLAAAEERLAVAGSALSRARCDFARIKALAGQAMGDTP